MFSVSVFYDERIVVVAEQRPDASEEDSFQWMSRVLQVSAPGVSVWTAGFVVTGGSSHCLSIFFEKNQLCHLIFFLPRCC